MIADFDHPLRELLLLADARGAFRYGLYFPEKASRILPLDYALLGCSQLNVFSTDEIEEDFRSKYVGTYRAARPHDDLASLIKSQSEAWRKPKDRVTPLVDARPSPRGGTGGAKSRLLIVSYFSGPCRTVGVQRVNYWCEELERLSKGRLETHLATAINWSSSEVNVHYVPDHHIASLLDADGTYPNWAHAFVTTETRYAKSFNTLSYYWRYALERYFDTLDMNFDVVIISGNPFAVFDFAVYAKRRWRARVILDYRDPFANNPRIKYRPEAREHARYVEKGYNLQADLALVVNTSCQMMLEAKEDIPSVIIPNGFDERIVDDIPVSHRNDDVIKFVHAGQFYAYDSLENLLAALTPGKHSFHHVGEIAGIPQSVRNYDTLVAHGRKSYTDTLRIISECDCGIVFLSEYNFETGTKIFDYLAMGIDILLCTAGETRQGVLWEMLASREGVYWCRNTKSEIMEFISTYRPTRKQKDLRVSAQKFSRRNSTKLLLQQIQRLKRDSALK